MRYGLFCFMLFYLFVCLWGLEKLFFLHYRGFRLFALFDLEGDMSLKKADIDRLVDVLNDVVEQSNNAQNRNFYRAQPPEIQRQIMQNAYNNGMTVKDISEVTGVATSTVYSKIKSSRS